MCSARLDGTDNAAKAKPLLGFARKPFVALWRAPAFKSITDFAWVAGWLGGWVYMIRQRPEADVKRRRYRCSKPGG